MGNIQNISCSDINCFDNIYEMDWFSEKNWNIQFKYNIFNPKNSYKIEKGIFHIINTSECLFYLNKKISLENEINKIIFNLKFEYVLDNINSLEFIFFISKNEIDNIFENNNINDIISKLKINENLIYIENKQLNKKKYIENKKNLKYKLIFDLNYMHYIKITEELYINKKEENQLQFSNTSIPKLNNDFFYFNIFIKSNINSENNYVKLKI